MPRVEEMVERVWPGREAPAHGAVGGGITNRNFLVGVRRGRRYVLRLARRRHAPARHPGERARRDRRRGRRRRRARGDRVHPARGLPRHAVHRGRRRPEAVRQPETLRRVAESLRASTTARRSRACSCRSGSWRRTRRGGRAGVPIPPEYELARESRPVERARRPVLERPCHNDLLNANFIDDGARIRIVDWEYAGMGDPFFDLAISASTTSSRRGDDSSCCLRRHVTPRPRGR